MTRLTIISFSDGFDPAIITPSFLKGNRKPPMPAKRSINENSGFLGGGKGNGPSMASNILDVLADFIERAGGRIFTQGCLIRQQSGYLISTRTLKKL